MPRGGMRGKARHAPVRCIHEGSRFDRTLRNAAGGIAFVGDFRKYDEWDARSGAVYPAHRLKRIGLPKREIKKDSFRCRQLNRRDKRWERRDDIQFQCAFRPGIKRAQGFCRFSWKPSLPTTREISFHSCVEPHLGGLRAQGVKKETASRNLAAIHRCEYSSRINFWRDWRGQSSGPQIPKARTSRKGVVLFWPSRRKSQ